MEHSVTAAPGAQVHSMDTADTADSAGIAGMQALPVRRTVLYVEDNPVNYQLVEQLLERRDDLRLLPAPNASTGIALARSFLPEVILMDINLPGISGYDALQILHESAATAHIPVIALSAQAMPREIERGLAAGFFGYLTKPIRIDLFMDALDVALLHAQQHRAAGSPASA